MQPTFILLLIGGVLPAQNFIQGNITAAETGEVLPYVNIGIPSYGIGTVSDVKGEYQLEIPSHLPNETLRFSMIGFQSYELNLRAGSSIFNSPFDVVLLPETTVLEEVVVTHGIWKTFEIGNKTQSKLITAGFTSNQLGNEMALFVRVKKNRPTRLQSF